jgi:hypothetical protein
MEDASSGRLSDQIAKLVSTQHTLIEIARDNQLSSGSYHMKEASSFSHIYPVNSYVLFRPPDSSRTKMKMPKVGPFIVVSISGYKYSVQDLLTHKVIDTHVSNLCEFKYDRSYGLHPAEVAARNAGEFFIDKIIEHTGLARKRSDMKCRVRWRGYNPDDDTWEPYKAVRQTQAFVDYCKEKNMSSLVSKNLKG